MKRKEGEYFDKNHYDLIVKQNCDCYGIDKDGKKNFYLS